MPAAKFMSGRRGSNSRPIAWKAIALPTELLPLLLLWGEKDSNLRSLATTELQSVPFGHSGISPKKEPPIGIEPMTY